LSLVAAILALAAGAVLRAPTPWVALAAAAAATGARTLASDAVFQARLGPFWPLIDQIALSAALICVGCALLERRAALSAGLRGVMWAGLGLFVCLAGLSAWGAGQGARTLEAAGLALPLLGAAFLLWTCARALKDRTPRSARTLVLEGWVLGLTALAAVPAVALGSGLVWGLWVLGLETAYGVSVLALSGGLAALTAFLSARGVWRWARDRPRLSRIIRSQREEIEATSLALQQQVKRSAVLEERQRLSRDMHDGIGGQLMSLLARVRTGRISPDQLEGELTSGLSELRLMVDSLDASEGSVADALAVLRSRIRTQTEAAGIILEWSQAGDLNLVVDEPRWILNLNRLIQEAATNAVRHSGGDRIRVSIEATGDRRLTVTIADNGAGFDRAAVEPGRGLSNLAFRAVQLGGRLDIRRSGPAGGTTVTADIPALPGSLEAGTPGDQSSGDMIPS
jgi:signal transduction histidine kinase